MYTGIYQTMIVLSAVLVFYTLDVHYMTRFDPKRSSAGSGRSYSYTFIVALMVLFLAAQPIFVPQISLKIPGPVGLAVQGLGVGLMACAVILHSWARSHLRELYAERVEIQPGHRLVESGPYRHIRHPAATSIMLFATGIFLTNPGLVSVFVLGFAIWDLSYASRREEELLSQKLPGYAAYLQRTTRYFPRLKRSQEERLKSN
jgi:protein-S-isoprenylcysteine O-methyltransferase Ste14